MDLTLGLSTHASFHSINPLSLNPPSRSTLSTHPINLPHPHFSAGGSRSKMDLTLDLSTGLHAAGTGAATNRAPGAITNRAPSGDNLNDTTQQGE